MRATESDLRLDPDIAMIEELQNFEEIATCLLPSPGETPTLRGVEICGHSLPLNGVVGGDHIIYLDFNRRYDLPSRIARAERAGNTAVARKLRGLQRRAGILVADVSGHRMTDALIAAMLHQAFLLGVYYELDLSGEVTTRLFEHINSRFHQTTAIHKYFTMLYGEISQDGNFRFLSSGHQLPLVFSREYGRFVPIGKDRLVSFPPVGMLPSGSDPDERVHATAYPLKKRYEVNEINLLSPGDFVLLFTDGLAEHDRGRYLPVRLERELASMRNATAADICATIRAEIDSTPRHHDDISFVAIRRTA